MTKIAYLRKVWAEQYESDLKAAAETGEALLREHWHNKNFHTIGYANDLFNLGCVHEELGNLERAAALFSDSAQQQLAANGDELSCAERVNSLATVLIRLEFCEPAFLMLGNVAAVRRRLLGENDVLYADALYNLANAAAELGQTKEALRYHLQALKIREKFAPVEDIVNSLHSIAFVYETEKTPEKGIIFAQMATIFSEENDVIYASSCNYLAELYENTGDYDAALPLYDKVLEITGRESATAAHLNVALRRANLLSLMQRPEESLAAHEEICTALTFSTRSVFYANCLRGMAMLHNTLENPTRAEECLLEAMKIRRAMCEDITLDITFLIRLYLSENNTEKALEALVYALMCSGSNSPEYNEMLDNLEEVFSKSPAAEEFITAMELLNDREKLRPILNKWEAWEQE
ncbi:MAG: tetratricopeptide repeat-containing protein [Defluviitaleaceae bacterium]|nr:tetratricopeptide repeat-containing protein [Defluviitaleaceae bacterium]